MTDVGARVKRHHPDVNKGCEISSRRFQEVKTAYEQIESTRVWGGGARSAAADGGAWRGSSRRAAAQGGRYRYTGGFYGMRGGRGGGGGGAGAGGFGGRYGKGQRGAEWGWGGAVDGEMSFQRLQRRVRMMERAGGVAAVLVVGASVTFAAVGTEVVWQGTNRGKSFDELMRRLDEQKTEAEQQTGAGKGG